MPTNDSTIISFLAELVSRLFSKTPAFFKVIQILSAAVAIVTGIPTLLLTAHIALPAALALVESKVIAIAGLVSLFISSLPVTTNTASLPYTAKTKA